MTIKLVNKPISERVKLLSLSIRAHLGESHGKSKDRISLGLVQQHWHLRMPRRKARDEMRQIIPRLLIKNHAVESIPRECPLIARLPLQCRIWNGVRM